ncbi:19100_t:CDS:1 [Gigaspora margarita]|uniref:19100_t:CDS:1 n=1 Tax=Gigaspora margarita TaxID=4874 RepID=A0ABN7W1P5_GIGMA|nr:19100_t:CDS:1 [Gigaspora margarita]
MSDKKINYIILLVIALSLFFGLLFGLGYPEIKRAEYYPTTCTIENETIKSRYCCYTDCNSTTCHDAPSSAPSCLSLESRWNASSPTQCSLLKSQNNGDYCPIVEYQAICDNGYYCCSENCPCNTCPSGYDNTTCTTYNCECWCNNFSNHRSCEVKCPECYTMELMVQYPIRGDEIMISNISVNFDQDLTDAQKFLSSNPIESKVQCYYNPENPLQVLLFVDYSVQTWILVGISALLLTVVLFIGTNYILHKVSFLQDINYRIFSLQSGIWIGTIFPLLFFFLLLIPITDKHVLLVLSLCFITTGWTPLLISSIIKFKRKSFIMACFITLLLFILPITIFGLTAILISTKIKKLSSIILAIVIPISYIFWIIDIQKLFYKIFNEKKESIPIQELPTYTANYNENPIVDEIAPPTYEEAISNP